MFSLLWNLWFNSSWGKSFTNYWTLPSLQTDRVNSQLVHSVVRSKSKLFYWDGVGLVFMRGEKENWHNGYLREDYFLVILRSVYSVPTSWMKTSVKSILHINWNAHTQWSHCFGFKVWYSAFFFENTNVGCHVKWMGFLRLLIIKAPHRHTHTRLWCSV